MNLYRIWQDVETGHDTYDSAIVAAESVDDARNISPSGDWGRTWGWGAGWAHRPEQVAVELIGVAVEGTKRGLVLASFNAG